MGEGEAKTSVLRMERLARSLIYANLVEHTSVPATHRGCRLIALMTAIGNEEPSGVRSRLQSATKNWFVNTLISINICFAIFCAFAEIYYATKNFASVALHDAAFYCFNHNC